MLSDIEAELERENLELRAQLQRERRARELRTEVHQLAAVTSGMVSRSGVAGVIAQGASGIFSAGWTMAAYVGDDDIVRFSHGAGVPDDIVSDWNDAPLSTSVPVCDVLRGDAHRIELTDVEDFAPWPIMLAEVDRADMRSIVVWPIGTGDRPVAVVAIAWPDPYELDDLDRELLELLVKTATPAFERAVKTESDGELAEAVQAWMLEFDVPDIAELEFGFLYEPGKDLLAVGGDWFDVIQLDGQRTAVVVGDVVGHDVRAAVQMSHVRHVLATHILATGDAVAAFELTDHYLRQRTRQTMATALVAVIEADGRFALTSAGHLPPVISSSRGDSRVIAGSVGPPLGSGLGGYNSQSAQLESGDILIAYTDGVVESRSSALDQSIAEFALRVGRTIADASDPAASDPAASDPAAGDAPVDRLVGMLHDLVNGAWRTDDAAAVVAQFSAPPVPTEA